MTQEEKQLLLADICARLPYKTFAQWHHRALNEFRNVKIMKISTYGKNIDDYYINVLCQPEPGVDYEASIVDIKPYLRPIDSMTEEEFLEYHNIKYNKVTYRDNWKRIDIGKFQNVGIIPIEEYLDWLNEHHFDYRGLIKKGLAWEAPEGMYDI